MKTCSKCERSLPLEDFHKCSKVKSGRKPHCKQCALAYNRAYLQKDPERISARNRAYRQDNKELFRQACKKSRMKHAESIKEAKRQRYRENPEPARMAARRWAKDNPEKAAIRNARRRARKARNWTDPRPEDVARRQALHEIAAWLRERGDDVAVDHIMPVALGGPETYSNLRILTSAENAAKGARPPTDEELEVVTLMVQSCG